MAKNSCILVPEVNGEASTLFNDLLKRTKNRPLTAYIYSIYTTLGIDAQMDAKGYKRNEQGQHSEKDVYNFLGVGRMITEASDMFNARLQANAIDNVGDTIKYTDAVEALNNASTFNNTHKGTVASVVKHGDYFEIIVDAKDSRTQVRSAEVDKQLQLWDALSQAFRSQGINIDDLSFARGLVNPLEVPQFLNYLGNITSLDKSSWNLMTQRDLQILFTISQGTSQVKRLVTKYGSIEEAANKVSDILRGAATATSGETALIETAIEVSRKLGGLSLNDLSNTISQLTQGFNATRDEVTIQDELNALNKKYGINAQEIHLIGDEINTLAKVAAEAAVVIERQIRQLEIQQGTTQESKQLDSTLRMLMRELSNKHYYAGLLSFLGEAQKQISTIDDLLNNINTGGTNMENAVSSAKALMQVKSIMDAYYGVISAIADINSLVIDENISDYDKQVLQQQAAPLREYLDKKTKVIQGLKRSTMLNIATEYLGDTLPNGIAISNIVLMQEKDLSINDYLYGVGRLSDPIVAVMGNIIRDAQDSRDKRLGDVALRIRRATNALYAANHDSSFMYDENGRIISDIDWDSYYKARNKAIKSLKNQGLKGLELKDAIQQWENDNTEDRIVDMQNGRTERVPNSGFRKEFPQLDSAQQQYYDTMMQLKGELGSLLPAYAQQQYIPPQIRRYFWDALKDAKSAKDVARAIWNKVRNIWTIREDDTDFHRNSIVVEGEDYAIAEGDFNNNPIRDIPIFYVNILKDQTELRKNFSAAIQALASTAINYDSMNKIKDVVEFMGDYLKNDRKFNAKKRDEKQADVISNNYFRIVKDLYEKAKNSNTSSIIDGFIAQHLYGEKTKGGDKITKVIQSFLTYNSLKSLALNVKGAIANYTVGELQMMIEAASHEFYGFKDYAWAHKTLFGGPKQAGRIAGMLVNDRNSKEYLLSVLFDPVNENYGRIAHENYHRSFFRQIMSGDFAFLGYGVGEYLIHYVNMYAMLHHQRVIKNGTPMSLYEAFEVGNKVDGNSELILGDDVTDVDGNPIDDAWLARFKKRIRYVNQTTHGAMNEEDKGIIHQYWLGKCVMSFRQWMVEHYSRRFRGSHYDATLGKFVEGYYTSVGKLMLGWAQDLNIFQAKAALHWDDMNEHQRANVKRCVAEQMLTATLLLLSLGIGDPDDDNRDFWRRMFMYQTKRAFLDMESSNPVGAALNFTTLMNSPIPALTTAKNTILYPIYGIGDIGKEVKRGRHKGENKYWYNIKKKTIPFWKDIDQITNFEEEDDVFQVFRVENKYK